MLHTYQWFREQLLEPIHAMRVAYVPFLMVYFAYGLTGITAVAGTFWTKEVLHFTPAQLALAGFWAGIPWTLKMLFGQCVDARPIFGSPRRAYIFAGASLVTLGYLMLAGLAGAWGPVMKLGEPINIYFIAAVVMAVGLVMQDVTADALTSELNTGDERDARSIQALGRIALMTGGVVGALFAGHIAENFSYQNIYLIACVVPLMSIAGALWLKQNAVKRCSWNMPILLGGFGFALFVILVSASSLPAKAEIVFVGNVLAIGIFLFLLGRTLSWTEACTLLATGIVVFIFRAMPSAGAGVSWWQIEVLGFDRAFLGRLQLVGSLFGLCGLFLAARSLRNQSVTKVLVIVTIVGTILSLPTLAMYYGLHHYTEQHFGFGARSIALVDSAVSAPFGQLAMVPMLALIAVVARRGSPATWFALSASFMNLPLATADLATAWMNEIWVVTQATRGPSGEIIPGDFKELGTLLWVSIGMGLVLPLLSIALLRKYLVKTIAPSP